MSVGVVRRDNSQLTKRETLPPPWYPLWAVVSEFAVICGVILFSPTADMFGVLLWMLD